jgi:DNA-binding transcriptional LysR family regulator
VPTFSAAVLIAAATELVAGVPRRLARTFSARVPLQILELPTPPLIFSMSVVWQERTDRDAGSRYFRELLIEAARGVDGARRRA